MSAHVLSEEDTEKRKKTTIVDLWKFTELFIGGRVFVFRVITHSSVCMLITQGGGWDVGVDGALEMNWSTREGFMGICVFSAAEIPHHGFPVQLTLFCPNQDESAWSSKP